MILQKWDISIILYDFCAFLNRSKKHRFGCKHAGYFRASYLVSINAKDSYLKIRVKDGQINFIIFLKKKIYENKIQESKIFKFLKQMDKN